MAIASLEGLQARLDRDLAWRKKEIAVLREAASGTDERNGPLFRAGLVLLCAHLEGFIKRALDSYIDHVFAQGLRDRQLLPCFVAVSYYTDVTQAATTKYPGSDTTHLRLAERIAKGGDEVCGARSWWATAEGNPGSDVVTRLLKSAGLDEQLQMDDASWSTTKVFIDEHIVRDRNSIAHGDGLPIVKIDFLARAQRMTSLLDAVSNVVISSAQSKAYRHGP